MTSDLRQGIIQLCAVEELAWPGSSSVPFSIFDSGSYPRWQNIYQSSKFDHRGDPEHLIIHTVLGRLVLARLTAGYRGEIEGDLVEKVDAASQFCIKHPLLQTPAQPIPPPNLVLADLISIVRDPGDPSELALIYTFNLTFEVDISDLED